MDRELLREGLKVHWIRQGWHGRDAVAGVVEDLRGDRVKIRVARLVFEEWSRVRRRVHPDHLRLRTEYVPAVDCEQRHLCPPRIEWPGHERMRLKFQDCQSWQPYTYVLGPWQHWDQQWWSWCRLARPSSKYAQSIQVARIHINGCGADPELRFQVHHPTDPQGVVGCDNSFREGCEDIVFPTGSKLWGSRGVNPTAPGDVVTLMQWCDVKIAAWYHPFRVET